MTKEQLRKRSIPIIKKIAKNRRNQKFAYYEGADIEQEIWVFCLEALNRYDPQKASPDISTDKQIEHFLNHHVTNRLKNLMRDRYFRPESDKFQMGHTKTRINLINALPLDICDIDHNTTILGSINRDYDPESHYIAQEMREYILWRIPEDLIDSFVDLLDGNKIKKSIELKLRSIISEILLEFSDD
jgi:hypothetical protein